MVVPVLAGVVEAADVDDGVAGCKKGRVPGTKEGGGAIGGQETEHVHCEGFVGVEVAAGDIYFSSLYLLCQFWNGALGSVLVGTNQRACV